MSMNFATDVVVNTGHTLTVNGKEVAPAIIADTDKTFAHAGLSNVRKITFHGNEYAFKTCRYANEKNLVLPNDRTYTTIGVEVQCVDNYIIMNGTGTSTANTNAIDVIEDIPAGNYVAYIYINANGTVISISKTFDIVVYYTDDTSETFSKAADVDDITIDMTFAKDVNKLRIRPGIRQDVVYTDYTFWVGVFSEDVVITDTNLTVQDEATVDYVAQVSDTVIDTMQHESVVSYIADTKTYVDEHGGIYYGSSSSGSSDAEKAVTVSESFYDASNIPDGTVLYVNFTNQNTRTYALKLNINSGGGIYVSTMDGGDGNAFRWNAGEWVQFVFLNSRWKIIRNGAMHGATFSHSGKDGLVPAPSFGDQDKFLKGDGTWETPVGSRVFVVDLDTVTNTSGSYTHTTTVSGMTGDLKAVAIECSDPSIFKSKVTITTSTDSVTLTCNEVAGTSTVKVSFLAVGNANPLSSTEYAALDTRIGDLSDLTTTDKTSVVNAVNELNGMSAMSDYTITHNASTSHTYTMGAGRGACLLMVAGSGGSRYWVGYVFRASAQNNMAIGEIVKGSNTTASTSGDTLTLTFDSSTATDARVIHIAGEKLT